MGRSLDALYFHIEVIVEEHWSTFIFSSKHSLHITIEYLQTGESMHVKDLKENAKLELAISTWI